MIRLSTSVDVFDSIFRIAYRQTQPIDQSIYPRVNVVFEMTQSTRPGAPAISFILTNLNLKLLLIKGGVIYQVGQLVPARTFLNMSPGSSSTINCDLSLDHYGLGQIEKLREGGDLSFRVEGKFVVENPQQPQAKFPFDFSLDFRIPKSDWVEDILPRLKYKDIILIEIPRVIEPQFEDVMTYVNGAWRQYSMGEYDKVLTECRKALEKLSDKIRSQGYEKENPTNQGSKKIPDWDKLMGNSELGDVAGSIYQKLWRFVAPGAHAGKAINREDADFALMITHAVVNLAAHRLS